MPLEKIDGDMCYTPLIDFVPRIFDPGTFIVNRDLGAADMLIMPLPSFCVYNKLIQPSVIETRSSKSSTGKFCCISTFEKVGMFSLNAGVQMLDTSKELLLSKEGPKSCDWGYEVSVITSLELDVYFCVDTLLMIIFDPRGSPLHYKGCSFLKPNSDQQTCAFSDFWMDEWTNAEVQLCWTDSYSRNENNRVYSTIEEFKYGIYLANHGALFLFPTGGSYYLLRAWHWNSYLEFCTEQQGQNMMRKNGKDVFSFDPGGSSLYHVQCNGFESNHYSVFHIIRKAHSEGCATESPWNEIRKMNLTPIATCTSSSHHEMNFWESIRSRLIDWIFGRNDWWACHAVHFSGIFDNGYRFDSRNIIAINATGAAMLQCRERFSLDCFPSSLLKLKDEGWFLLVFYIVLLWTMSTWHYDGRSICCLDENQGTSRSQHLILLGQQKAVGYFPWSYDKQTRGQISELCCQNSPGRVEISLGNEKHHGQNVDKYPLLTQVYKITKHGDSDITAAFRIGMKNRSRELCVTVKGNVCVWMIMGPFHFPEGRLPGGHKNVVLLMGIILGIILGSFVWDPGLGAIFLGFGSSLNFLFHMLLWEHSV